MELFVAIAMLCQVSSSNPSLYPVAKYQLDCQQTYIHCVNVKNKLAKQDALEKCILEKKTFLDK